MGYVLAAILIISTVFSGGFCRSHSFLGPEFCSGGLEGPQPIVWSRPCRWYVDCVRNDDGSLTAYHEKCPRGLLFDPVSKTCTAAAGGSGRVRQRRMVKREDDPLCNKKALNCGDDCKTLHICAKIGGEFKALTNVTCGGSTPYCSNQVTPASCVSQLPDQDGCESGFVCTAEGTIPDPKNCSVYHYCYLDKNGKTLNEAMGYCEPGYVFSSDLEDCKLRTSSYDCHVATCPSGATGYFTFPLEPRFYVMCVAGSPNYVFQCPEGKEYTNKGTCEVVCKKAGKFPNPDVANCKGYIECLPTTSYGPPYKRYEKTCPGALTFKPSSNNQPAKCANDYTCPAAPALPAATTQKP